MRIHFNRLYLLLPLVTLLWTFAPLAHAAPPNAAADSAIDTKVQIDGDEIRTDVSFFVRAPQQHVWSVITDFDRAADFFRDLQSSKVISRSGDTLRVLQKDQVRFGPFAYALETLKQVKLTEPVRTESHLISGTMKKYDSTTQLIPERDGTRIVYRSLSVPPAHALAFIGESSVRQQTEERFRELRTEILRRQQVAATQ